MSADGTGLTWREKVSALVEHGLAEDEADARAQLVDMGEEDPGEMHDRSGDPDYSEREEGHDCPRERFLDDPITVEYGVGSEMVHLVPCAICDAEEASR